MTKIEWTNETWNPIVGCSVASPGCTNCYAMRTAWRLARNPVTPWYRDTVEMVNHRPVWTGKLELAPESTLAKPIHRARPTVWFVNSMGDLFHEAVPDEWLNSVFAIMDGTRRHTYQILTKRARRLGAWAKPGRVPENVWLGVSVEDQKRASERVPELLKAAAAVRFVSAEPLLGPVDLSPWLGPDRLNWVIAGSESGPGARPMSEDWVRSLRDQCTAAGVPFFYKQRLDLGRKVSLPQLDGEQWVGLPNGAEGAPL